MTQTSFRVPLVGRQAATDDPTAVVDWESPAGPVDTAPARERPSRCAFSGPGEPRWFGQPCEIIGTAGGQLAIYVVVLACGCRAEVPRSALD